MDGIVYSIGGAAGADFTDAYDPATDAWTTRAPMPSGRDCMALAVLGKTIYAMGGRAFLTRPMPPDQPGWYSFYEVEAYDTTTNRWRMEPRMLRAVRGLAGAAVDGVLYSIGGNDSSKVEALMP